MQRQAIITALEAYRINRGSGTSEPLRAVDVVGIADAILEACPVPDIALIAAETSSFGRQFVAFQEKLLLVPTPDDADEALLRAATAFRQMADTIKDQLAAASARPGVASDKDPAAAPAPPWAAGGENNANAKRRGWEAFFERRDREDCPFPPARGDLQRDYRVGWDAAQAFNTAPPSNPRQA